MKFQKIVPVAALLLCADAEAQNFDPPAPAPPSTISGNAVSAVPQSSVSAVTVVSGEELQLGEITSARDLTAQTPNLSVFDSMNQRMPMFSIRGFRENGYGLGEPVIGLYVDDVPYFDMFSRGLALYDARGIEFVRGSQATMYGAGGVGGVIDVSTAQPVNRTQGYMGASYGNYNAQQYIAGIGGPIVTNILFFGLNGLDDTRLGYVYDDEQHKRTDFENTMGIRGTLRWTPSLPWNITLMADAGQDNDGFVPTYWPGVDSSPFNVSRSTKSYVDTHLLDQALKIGFAGSSVMVTSVTTHRSWDQDSLQQIPSLSEPAATAFATTPTQSAWTEELRVQSADATSNWKWLVGGYFSDNDLNDGSVVSSPAAPPSSDIYSSAVLTSYTFALFGQATLSMGDKFDATAGIRLNDDFRYARIEGGGAEQAQFASAQPKLGLTYHFTPKIEVYGTATSGHQSGGFDPYNGTEYGSERDWQFELGAKSRWLHDKLSANAALFYTLADDYQTYNSPAGYPFTGPSLAFPAPTIGNAPRAKLFGAELELTYQPVKSLDLSAIGGFTGARYTTNGNFFNVSGEPISFVPEFTVSGSLRYRLPWWHLYAHGEVIAVGRFYLDDPNAAIGQTRQDAYFLLNAQAGYEGKHFQVYAYAKNILDAHYYNGAQNPAYAGLALQTGDPTTFGIAATAKF